MKKKIARKFAMLLAFIVLTTTFASDYNSIGAKASDEAGVESQIQDETADATDETIEDAAPAEEEQPEQDEDAAPAEETAPAETAQADDAAQVEENEQTEDAAPAEGEQNEEAAPAEEPAPADAAQAEDASQVEENEQTEDAAPAEGEQNDEAAPAEETAPADETAQSEDAAQADGSEDDQNQPAAGDASADGADQSADTQDDANADAADNSADGTAQADDETAKADADTVDTDAAEDADEEQEIITITYKASEGGSVSVESEEVTDKAEGSTAEADEGYEFVNWTYDEKVVSEKATFAPKGDLLVDGAEFTANFAEVEEKAFAAETVVDNIRITLYANPGVLPEDAELRVEKVSPALEAQIEEKIDEVTGEDVEVKKTISFDINIYSPSLGKFVQPEDGTVEVRFSQIEEAKGSDTELSVYHVEDDLSKVTDMNAVTGDTEAKIDAGHFSTYTLSLTVKAKNKKDESMKVRVIAVNEKGENLFGTGNGNGKEFEVNLEKGKEVPVAEFEKTLGIRNEDSDFENYEFSMAYKNASDQDKHEIVSFFVKEKNDNKDALYYKLKNGKEESNSSAVIFVYSEKKQEEMADIIVLATYEGSYTDAKGEKLKKLLNLDTVKAYAPLGVISLPRKALEGYGNNVKFSNNANAELYGDIVSAFDNFKCGTDVISTNNNNTIVANLSKVAKNNGKTELCYFENGNQYKEDDFVGDYKTCHYHLNLCFDDSAFVNEGEELVYYYLLDPGLELPDDSKSFKTYYPVGQGHDFSGTAVSHDKIADADKDEYGNVWDPTGKKVKTYLKSSPDEAILAKYLEKYKDKYPLSAENYEIVWYTYKVTNSDTFWHVDGFVREKEKVEYVDVAVYAVVSSNSENNRTKLANLLGLDLSTFNTSYGSAPVGVTRLPKSMFPSTDKGERYYASLGTEEIEELEGALSGINTGSDVLKKNVNNKVTSFTSHVDWNNKRSALKYFLSKTNDTFVSAEHQTCKYHLDLCFDVSKKVTVTYNRNFDENDTISYDDKAEIGTYSVKSIEKVIEKKKQFKVDGYAFKGWNTKADGSGEAYAADDNKELLLDGMKLYAQWEEKEFDEVVVYATVTGGRYDDLKTILSLDADGVNNKGYAPVGVIKLPRKFLKESGNFALENDLWSAVESEIKNLDTSALTINKTNTTATKAVKENIDFESKKNNELLSVLKVYDNAKSGNGFSKAEYNNCKYHLDLCFNAQSITKTNRVTLSVRKFGYERPTFADGSVDGTGQKLVKYLSFSRDKGEYNGTTGFGCGYGTADFLEDKDGFKVVEYTEGGKDHSYVGGEGVDKAYNLTVSDEVKANITAALAEYSKEHPEYAGYTYDDIRWYVYKHANEPDSRYEWHFDGELVPHEEMTTVAIYATPGKDSLYEDEFVEMLGLDKDDHFVDSNWYSPIGEVSLPKSVCEAGLTDENLNDVLDAVLENGVNTSDKVLKKNIENGIENFLKNNRDKIVKPSTSGKTKLFANTGKSGFTKECKFDYHLDLYVYFLGSEYISFYILKDKNAEGEKIEIPLPQSLGGPHGCPDTDYAPGSTEWKGTVEKKLSELVTDEAKDNYYAPYDKNTGEYISGAGHTTNVLENVDQFDKAAQPGMNAYLKSTYEPKYGGEQLTADDVVWYVFKKVGNNNYHIDGYPTASVTYHSNYPEELEKDEETSVIEQRVGFDHWTLGDEGSFVAEGYAFNGYFLDKECTQPAQECFESVHERMHLYANWVKKPKLVANLKENGYKEIRKTYDGKEHEAEIDLELKLYNAENLQLDIPPAEDTPEIIGALTNLYEKFANLTSINASADDGATPITQEVKDDKGNVYVVTGLKVKGGKGTDVKLDADGNVTSYDAVLVYVPEDISIKLGDMELNDQIDFEIQGLVEGKDLVVGKLFIDPRNVELSSPSAEKVYDKTPLTAPDITISGDGFADGEGATFDVTGSQTEVGQSKNEFTYTLYDGTNGTKETKATNYVINKTEGILKVTPVTEEKKDEDPNKDPEKPSDNPSDNPSDKPSNNPSDNKSDETTTENGNSEQGKTSESEKEEEKEEKENKEDKKKKDDKKKKEDKKSESNNSGEESSSDSAQGSSSEQRTPGVEAPRGSVLGASRDKVAPETEKAGVLGARRAGTEDETNTARIFILLVAAGAATTFIALGKKKNKEEDE